MNALRSIAVFCGSSSHVPANYLETARSFGSLLGVRGIDVVYGGGRVGSMGAVADGARGAGGRVIGVIPEKLQSLELAHHGLDELRVVPDMHARKKQMADLADAFVALPGGYGTLEELFEAVTWTQLGYHHKPVGILNIDGYYDGLIAFLGRAARDGFVRGTHVDLVQIDTKPQRLLLKLASVELPTDTRWLDDV